MACLTYLQVPDVTMLLGKVGPKQAWRINDHENCSGHWAVLSLCLITKAQLFRAFYIVPGYKKAISF